MVNLFFEDVLIPDLSSEFFSSWLKKVCKREDKTLGNVCLIFCSDNYLLQLNKEYLNHDYFTDIITFDYTKDDTISGDLFISYDRIKENASQNNVKPNMELNRVVVHGVLHLIGYDDKADSQKKEMRQKENDALELIVPRGTI